ncbi:hypothetical protein EON65_56840 [archaeon]|nr:MAG: hypothetical protein EON65_56840 [archaeon]
MPRSVFLSNLKLLSNMNDVFEMVLSDRLELLCNIHVKSCCSIILFPYKTKLPPELKLLPLGRTVPVGALPYLRYSSSLALVFHDD